MNGVIKGSSLSRLGMTDRYVIGSNWGGWSGAVPKTLVLCFFPQSPISCVRPSAKLNKLAAVLKKP